MPNGFLHFIEKLERRNLKFNLNSLYANDLALSVRPYENVLIKWAVMMVAKQQEPVSATMAKCQGRGRRFLGGALVHWTLQQLSVQVYTSYSQNVLTCNIGNYLKQEIRETWRETITDANA